MVKGKAHNSIKLTNFLSSRKLRKGSNLKNKNMVERVYNLRSSKINKKITNNITFRRRKLTKDNKDSNSNIVVEKTMDETWKILNKYFKPSTTNIISENIDWVSATATKNYLLRDSLIDWLDLYYYELGYNEGSAPSQAIAKNYETVLKEKKNVYRLFDKGNEFETEIVDYLHKTYKDKMKTVCNREQFRDKTKFNDTLKYMHEGVPIIEQAMLCNYENKTFGVADLLIRSDYVNQIFNTTTLTVEEEYIKAPNLNGNYHYIVIDIKWSSIPLCANGTTILNSERYLAYKGQLAIYNLAMGMAQGYIPNKAYILGKGWKNKSEFTSSYNAFNKLCAIDYENFDNSYIEKTANAVAWMRDVRVNGREWSPINPKRTEMYPNMCTSTLNPQWNTIKNDLATKLNELTSLWMVGIKNRIYGHDHGIYKWTDANCSAINLNINGQKIGPTVDKIISINRDGTDIIMPKKIINNDFKWKKKHEIDMYIDLETLNENLMECNMDINDSQSNNSIIFMIGVGMEINNKFIYKSFIMESYSLENEAKIINEFIEYTESMVTAHMKEHNIKHRHKIKPRMFHWGHAEESFFNIANNRHGQIWDRWFEKIQMVDFCKIFTTEPIVIKGMMKFKLKEVAKAMYNHRMINVKWDENGLSDGLTAMMDAIKYYENLLNFDGSNNDANHNVMVKIRDYNKTDCEVVWAIVNYLRTHNI
jgi:hypothetical protein